MEKYIPTKLPESSMKNIYRIIWSDASLNNLKSIIEYLQNNWTEREIKKFAQLLDNRISFLTSNPYSFPATNHPMKLRKIVISKQISIFYQPFENHVRIVSLFDNRRNPAKINKL